MEDICLVWSFVTQVPRGIASETFHSASKVVLIASRPAQIKLYLTTKFCWESIFLFSNKSQRLNMEKQSKKHESIKV